MIQRLAYIIVDTQKDENGEFIPCIIKEDETGYYPTDYHWGTDKKVAQKCADDLNRNMGLTKEDVIDLLLGSLRNIEEIKIADYPKVIERFFAKNKIQKVKHRRQLGLY